MLIQLTPEQFASNWDFLRQCIVTNMPMQRDHREQDNNVLLALLGGLMQCWVEAKQSSNNGTCKTEIRAVVVTQVLEDDISAVSNLLIYSLYSLNSAFDISMWQKGILTLVRFAKSRGCDRILAYTGNDGIIKFMQRLGADASQTVLILPFN